VLVVAAAAAAKVEAEEAAQTQAEAEAKAARALLAQKGLWAVGGAAAGFLVAKLAKL